MSEERMGTTSSHDGHKDISNTDRVSLISAAVNSALNKQRQLFIGELDSKLGQPTKTAIKTVDEFVFQKEGNKIQHKFNTDRAIRLSDILTLVQSNRCEYAEVAIRSELEEIQQRNKLIKIADRHGWDTVREYTLHPLADNNEDAAKIRSAIARVSRKGWSAKPYERRSPPILPNTVRTQISVDNKNNAQCNRISSSRVYPVLQTVNLQGMIKLSMLTLMIKIMFISSVLTLSNLV